VYDCSLISDGAAAVILAPADRARDLTSKPVRILGVAQASDFVALRSEAGHHHVSGGALRFAEGLQMAASYRGTSTSPKCTIVSPLPRLVALEDLGFIERGLGGPWTASGATARTGEKPINASGGLKSKGHPVGATGVAQICDLFAQIRCEARRHAAQAAMRSVWRRIWGFGSDVRGEHFGECMNRHRLY